MIKPLLPRWFPLSENSPSHKKPQAGFTLIELMIAMSISAILAVLSYQSISQVVAVKSATEQLVEDFSKLQRVIWWIEQDLTQLSPRAIQDELGGSLPAYQAQGQGVEMTRIAVYPSPHGISGLVRVGYQLEDETLYRIIWPVLDRAPDTEPRRMAVLKNVESFSIRQLNDKNSWQDSWPIGEQSNTSLPKLIEMTLSLKGQGKIRRIFPGVDGLPVARNAN